MDYRKLYRGHDGILSGYRARKGIGKKLKSKFNRRVGKLICKSYKGE